MGLFTTRQLLGYTEQKVKFRALFLELFFRRTVNFHTEEVMLDKITGKTPVAAYVSPVVEGKVLRHRGGETRVLRPGYVKPKHEFNYQQAVERLPGEDPAHTATGSSGISSATPALTPLMLDEASGKLVVWDGQKAGSAVGILVLPLEGTETVLTYYKSGTFATEAIRWPESVDEHKKANAFAGTALSHAALP